MSLINEALKNLDARNQESSGGGKTCVSDRDDDANFSVQLEDYDKRQARRSPILLGALCCICVGAFLVLGGQYYLSGTVAGDRVVSDSIAEDRFNKIRSDNPVSTRKIEAPSTFILGESGEKDNEDRRSTSVVSAVVLSQEPSKKPLDRILGKTSLEKTSIEPSVANTNSDDSLITNLLSKAEGAIALNRLTIPEKQNARFFYREVLAIDSANVMAIKGLKRIEERYFTQLQKAIELEKWGRADSLMARAPALGFADDRLSELKNQYDLAKNTEEPKEPSSSAKVTLSASSKVQEVLRQADVLVGENRAFEAIVLLENHLDLNRIKFDKRNFPARGSDGAISKLFDLYLSNDKLLASQALIGIVGENYAGTHYFHARLADYSGQIDNAIGLLEQASSATFYQQQQDTLLAALYQRSQQYQAAQTLYRSLFKRYPDDSVYLLGFGLSSDALGEHRIALKSFLALLRHGRQSNEVIAYLERRVAALNQITKKTSGSHSSSHLSSHLPKKAMLKKNTWLDNKNQSAEKAQDQSSQSVVEVSQW